MPTRKPSEELLRVPFHVKFPKACTPPSQDKKYLSLSKIPSLIKYAEGKQVEDLFSDTVAAESFGPISDMSKYALTSEQKELFLKNYTRRVKVFGSQGSAIINLDRGTIEE